MPILLHLAAFFCGTNALEKTGALRQHTPCFIRRRRRFGGAATHPFFGSRGFCSLALSRFSRRDALRPCENRSAAPTTAPSLCHWQRSLLLPQTPFWVYGRFQAVSWDCSKIQRKRRSSMQGASPFLPPFARRGYLRPVLARAASCSGEGGISPCAAFSRWLIRWSRAVSR